MNQIGQVYAIIHGTSDREPDSNAGPKSDVRFLAIPAQMDRDLVSRPHPLELVRHGRDRCLTTRRQPMTTRWMRAAARNAC